MRFVDDSSCGDARFVSNEMYFTMPNITKAGAETDDNGNHEFDIALSLVSFITCNFCHKASKQASIFIRPINTYI